MQFTVLGVTLTLGQFTAAIPQIILLAREIDTLHAKLVTNGMPGPDALSMVVRIMGQQVLKQMMLPHKMTPIEEKIWMERGNKNVDNG